MAFRAGFPHVYRFLELPDHDNFQRVVGLDRIRTMMAAAAFDLDSPLLGPAVEPVVAASGRSVGYHDPHWSDEAVAAAQPRFALQQVQIAQARITSALRRRPRQAG